MAPTKPRGGQIASASVTDVQEATANIDGSAAVPSLRTLGSGALQACSGSDSRLSDARTPVGTALTAGKVWLGNASNVAAEATIGKVLLSTIVASNSATVDFTTGIDSTYKAYLVEWDGVKSGSTGNGLQMRISTDGGSTWKSGASDYAYSFCYWSSGGTTMTVQSSTGVASMNCAVAVITTTANFNPADSARFFTIETTASVTNSSTSVWASRGVGNYTTAGAVNAFRFLMQSGNIVSGTFRLYGLK
jgi:hypothetical protein